MASAHSQVRTIGRGAVALILAVLALLATAGAAAAGPGDLDLTFGGGDGFTTTNIAGDDTARAVVALPDGRYLAVGSSDDAVLARFSVVRYLANGTVDTTYGVNGVAQADFGQNVTGRSAVLQPDGKLVVAGYAYTTTTQDFAIARFTAGGSLDASFSGDGKDILDFSGTGALDQGWAVARQPVDGKLVIAGTTGTSSAQDFALARYNDNGTLDTTFSGDGKATLDLGGGDSVRALAVQPDGRIVAAGACGSMYQRNFGVARFTTSGSLDTSFSADGSVITSIGDLDYANAVALQPDARIVVAGYTDTQTVYDFALARYNADGSLDPSFSGDGIQTTDLGAQDYGYAVGVMPNGRIVAAGTAGADLGLTAYTWNGALDPSVSGDGIQTTDLGAADDAAFALAVQGNEQLVAAGTSNNDFLIARYQGDDTTAPDTTIVSGPSGATSDTTPTFTFSSNEAGVTFACSADGGPYVACTSPYTFAALADGVHSFRVRATDQAGNTDLTPALRTFTVDTTPPQTVIDSAPSGATNDTTPTFTFSASESGASFQYRLDGGTWYAVTSPLTIGTLGDGSHTFEVRATDPAGNTDATPASRVFTIDTVAPQTVIDSGPSGLINDSTPTFAFSSSQSGSTFQYRVDGGTWATCTSPLTLAALADGARTFEVRATDPAGNTDATPASRVFTLDTVAPQTTIDAGPSGPTNDSTPTFSFSAGESGVTYAGSVDAGAFSAVTSPYTLATLADGSHSFRVQATDAAGNVDPTPASRSFTVDTVAPQTSMESGPSGLINDATPTFEFSSSEAGSTFACSVDDGPFLACASPYTTPVLAQGDHTVRVQATDPAGNTDPTPAGRKFSVDTVAPQTTIDSGPSDVTGDPTPTFAFSASETGSTFQCRVDGGSWASCTSPHTLATLTDGAHGFEVRATDPAGNADATPASRSFTVDTDAPDTTIDAGPTGDTNDATPTFAFSASKPGATFEYSLDYEGFEPCQSPHTLAALPDGSHTFRVRAVDTAGNADPTPASRTFVVDTTAPPAPQLIRTEPGSPANDNAPRLKGAAASGSTVRIYTRADASGGELAEAPAAQLAGAGIEVQVADDSTSTFYATATDHAGNRSPVSHPGLAYAEDSTAPQTTLDSGPAGPTSDPTPTFAFSASEPGARFECQVDGGPLTPCGSPLTIGPLADGPHVFAVRAVDAAGNADPSPAAGSFAVSTAAPPDRSLDLTAAAKRTQRLKRSIALTVRCAAEPCRVTVSGQLRVPAGKRVKRYALRKVSRSLAAGQAATIRLTPPAKLRKAAARALAKHQKVTARITVRGTDAAGNADSVTLTVKLRA